jgi:hypothetical protein
VSKLRIVVLETEDADASTVAAIGNMIREMQETRGVTSASVETFVEPASEAPPQLPGKVRKARKPRAAKAEPTNGAPKRSRVNGAGESVLAAFRRSSRPDLNKLAAAIYADSSKTTKVKQVISYLVSNGKLNDHKDGSYSVVG